MRASLHSWVALLALLDLACTDRAQPHNELGQRLAQHLCAVETQCGCPRELLIPSCEARVEQEYIATERQALDAGLELDAACFEVTLDYLDGLAACDPVPASPGVGCPVYTAHAEVGEPCENYDFLPWMMDCRAGLQCIQGTCRDLENPHILQEGEICSDTRAQHATGWLGKCTEGLVCDSNETRTCIPSPYWPPVVTGGVCTSPISCVDESYCHTDDPEGPSEEIPGVCIVRTPEGQACDNLLECTTICTDGVCEYLPPRLCETLEEWWIREQL